MRAVVRSPLWFWAKVVLCVVALDLALFGTGLFFRLVPTLQRYPVTWGLVYRSARLLHAAPPAPGVYATGSSIVFLGVDQRRVQASLDARGVPTPFTTLTVFGASGVDQALLAHAAARTAPWLVVLTASVRDFPARGTLDTPTARVFDDASVALPPLAPDDVEGRLVRAARRWWPLYRYRVFVRLALLDAGAALVQPIAFGLVAPPPPSGPAPIPSASGAPVPDEAHRWFFPGRITAESWAAWTHWRTTRRFADYEAFLRANRSGAMEHYGRQTFATHGPDDNVQLDALAWAEAALAAAGIRTVVVAFPENPVLQYPEAREHYDTALADAVVARLAADARAHGARFVDLRDALDAEDFYDLIHPNLSGSQKLSERVADVVAEEWRAAGR